MRILVTNDDGFDADKALEDIKNPIEIISVMDVVNGVPSYSLDSTPADCVRIGKEYLKFDFDLLLSGVNDGYNLGEDILYSGTVGAATEAVLQGKKAIAFSTEYKNKDLSIETIKSVLDFIFKNDILKKANLLNINIPKDPKDIVFTKQGNTHFDLKVKKIATRVKQTGKACLEKEKENINSDVWAVLHNHISITPLIIDRTDFSFFKES